MVIEITQEYIDQFAVAWHDEDDKKLDFTDSYVPGDRRRAGLQRVIELIERDYRVEKKE